MAVDWQIGDRIKNRWHIHNVFKGGMGIVYIVLDTENWNVFAAKTFRSDVFAKSPRIADRFRQEALAWINLDIHENVVEAQTVEDIAGQPFLFLEWVIGTDLGRLIGRPRLTGNLPLALNFAIQFCDGMQHVLSRGIKAHRDIKPQNCLIRLDEKLKVSDFGLAKVFDDTDATELADLGAAEGEAGGGMQGAGDSPAGALRNEKNLTVGLTHTGAVAGTPPYMAPEQFSDAKRVDVRADVYSFGVMLYEMVSGRLPFVFRPRTLDEVWEKYGHAHRQQQPPELDAGSPELKQIVGACLAKDPARRFGDFGELRARLAHVYERLTGKAAPQAAVGVKLDAMHLADKGANLSALGRLEEGLAYIEQALELMPDDPITWSNKIWMLARLGRYEEALAAADHALELQPGMHVWANKSKVLRLLGRYEEALACADRAIELKPMRLDGWVQKGAVLKALGRYEEALSCFERMLELDPRDGTAWGEKGELLLRLGRTDEALGCLDRAVGYSLGDAGAYFYKGVILNEQGQYDAALASYERALELRPSFAEAWVNRGNLLLHLGRPEEALDCLDRALKLSPNEAMIWMNRGVTLSGLGRDLDAVASFEQAHRLGDQRAGMAIKLALPAMRRKPGGIAPRLLTEREIQAVDRINEGLQLQASGQHQEALARYRRAAELDPLNPQAWFYQGKLLNQMGDETEAITCLDRALDLHPRFSEAAAAKGVMLGASGRLEEALACLDRALEEDPRDATAWYNRGGALSGLGRHEEAVESFDNALRFGPQDAQAWFFKGVALGRGLQRYYEALECFERAHQLGHSQAGPIVKQLRQVLD